MALTAKQEEQIVALVKVGKLSNRAIAKEVGCSEGKVRTTIREKGVQKGEITQLVEREITNTIMHQEIEEEKNALNTQEKREYDKLHHDMTATLNMFNNATIQNQEAVNKIQKQITKEVDDAPEIGFQHLPNLMAINKITESNRKQLFGNTETYKPKEENEGQGNVTVIEYVEDKRDGT